MRPTDADRNETLNRRDEDTQLMVAFSGGSVGAFERLVRRNQERIFRLAQRYLRDPARAEDITQDVFIRVFHAAETYRPTAKFTTWVYRITVNLCLNALRDRRSRPEVAFESGSDESGGGGGYENIISETVNPAQQLEVEELSQAINRALETLPEGQRTVVLLRRYDELSYEEIAEVTGNTPAAVKSLLSRARQNLKSLLRKHL